MKEELCAAFCEGLEVAEVPIGIAVGTTYMGQTGDRIAFYITDRMRTTSGACKTMALRSHSLRRPEQICLFRPERKHSAHSSLSMTRSTMTTLPCCSPRGFRETGSPKLQCSLWPFFYGFRNSPY